MEDWSRDVMESRTGELKYTAREEPVKKAAGFGE